MIVPFTFVVAGLVAWAHYEMIGRAIMPGLSVWVAWYAAVLLSLAWLAVRSGEPSVRAGAAIMVASFLAAHVIWNMSAWPIAAQSIKNIAVAAMLLMAALALFSWSLVIAASIHLVIVAVGAAADLGLVLNTPRPVQFVAWSFPDVSAGLQHAALIVISFGAARSEDSDLVGDSGPDHDRWNLGVARREMPATKE